MAKGKLLRHKGYYGSYDLCFDTRTLSGKIEFIDALVTYEAETVAQLEEEFRCAVDDYLETCADLGYEPEKSMSGTLNVRIGSDLHKKVAVRAMDQDKSVNQVICEALESHFKYSHLVIHKHNHEHTHTHKVAEAVPFHLTSFKHHSKDSSVSGEREWRVDESARRTH